LALALGGCSSTSYGPTTVGNDQFNYNEAIAESENEELLLNLIRLRYSETLVFLKVSSVINQYSVSGSANMTAGLRNAVSGENSAQAGANVRWANNPTITYLPVSGREFSQGLLTPIPPGALIELIQSGWPVDLVLKQTTGSLNDARNEIVRPYSRRQSDPELEELSRAWTLLRDQNIMGSRIGDVAGERADTLFFRDDVPDRFQPAVDRFREILNLDPNANEISIAYGRVQASPTEIAVNSESIWEIMLRIAWQFDVPPEHIDAGRTAPAFYSERANGRPPIILHYSVKRPVDAFVAIKSQGHWFYISRNDQQSKQTFSFMQLLLNLAESQSQGAAPIISIGS